MNKNTELMDLLQKAVVLSKKKRLKKFKKIFSYWWSHKPVRVRVKTFWKEDMLAVIPEHVSMGILRDGFYEEGLTRMLLEYLRPGMTFFDIGAHFGYFTLLGSVLTGPQGTVYSFEPTPSTFSILKTNAKNKPNVILNNCALSSAQKTVFINDYGIAYSAYNSVYESRLPADTRVKVVPQRYETKAISIDEYLADKDVRPDFIKIDAESSEYEILLGMEKTIEKFRPMVSIEVGDVGIKGSPSSKDLISFFIKKGYQPYEFKEGRIFQHSLEDKPYLYDNILCLPTKIPCSI